MLDDSQFMYSFDGNIYTPPPNSYRTGHVWWLCETAEESVYVVIVAPRLEPDTDEEGHRFYSPEYDQLLVISPEGEREATREERDAWDDWCSDTIREGYRD